MSPTVFQWKGYRFFSLAKKRDLTSTYTVLMEKRNSGWNQPLNWRELTDCRPANWPSCDERRRNDAMTSLTQAQASPVEVGNIDGHGLWLLVDDKEYFLPYESLPVVPKCDGRADRQM